MTRGINDLDSKKDSEVKGFDEEKSEVAEIVAWKEFWKHMSWRGYSYRIDSLDGDGKNSGFTVVEKQETLFGKCYNKVAFDFDNLEEWIYEVNGLFANGTIPFNKKVASCLSACLIPSTIAKHVITDYIQVKTKVSRSNNDNTIPTAKHRVLPDKDKVSKESVAIVLKKMHDAFGVGGANLILYHLGHSLVQDFIPHTARNALLIQGIPGTNKSTFFKSLLDAAETLGHTSSTIPDRNFGWYNVWSSSFGFKDDVTDKLLMSIFNQSSFKTGITHGTVFVEEKGKPGISIKSPQATLTILLNDLPTDLFTLDSGIRDRLLCVSVIKEIPLFTHDEYLTMFAIGTDLFTRIYGEKRNIIAWLEENQKEASPAFYNIDYKKNIVIGTLAYAKSTLSTEDYTKLRSSNNLNFVILAHAVRAMMQYEIGFPGLKPLYCNEGLAKQLQLLIDDGKKDGNINMDWRKKLVALIEYDFGRIAASLSRYSSVISRLKESDIPTYEYPDKECRFVQNTLDFIGL